MSVVVVGVNERDAPIGLLERLSIGEGELSKSLQLLCDSPHLAEAVVLSTCLRTEVYAVLERFHDGVANIQAFFHDRLGGSASSERSLEELLVVSYDDAAAHHLFRVAAGIDSPVLGEGEILRQVRHAAESARREHASGPVLAGLFRHAVEVGKRARAETAIARGTTSLAHVAVDLAGRTCGGLDHRQVVVCGTGEMGQAIVGALRTRAASVSIVLAHRGSNRAGELAASAGARAVELAALSDELTRADVLITATTADHVLVDRDTLEFATVGRTEPLVVVDAAMPRDVDPAARELPLVELFDVGDLRDFADHQMAARHGEVAGVEAIIDEELERYLLSERARSVAPVVSALRDKAEAIRASELERISQRLSGLASEDRAALEAATKRIVAKLLHEPTVAVKQAAASDRGERLTEALRALFGL